MSAREMQAQDSERAMEESLFDFQPDVRVQNVIEPESDAPNQLSPEWSDYVMSQFADNELVEIKGDKYPSCYGLRRVTEELIGEIVESKPVNLIISPDSTSNNPGRVTCHYEVTVRCYHNDKYKTIGDVAEVFALNCDDIFLAYPAATAVTRAEGRCLRKLLKLRCVAAEEITRNKDVAKAVQQAITVSAPTDGSFNGESTASESQISFINAKCEQLGVDVLKFINAGEKKYSNIQEVTKKTASIMIQTLSDYQKNKKKIPESWRIE